MTRARLRRPASVVGRLAVELVVVSVAVYAAFALTEWQAEREEAERRRQIRQALVREIRDITDDTRVTVVWSSEMVARYDSAFAAAETPRLTPVIEPVHIQPHMWQATLQSGGLELLDVPTIFRISRFYNELNLSLEQLEQLRTLSESVLIPNLDLGPTEFYDDNARLRPKYDWYMFGLRRVAAFAQRITAMGDSVVAELGDVTR